MHITTWKQKHPDVKSLKVCDPEHNGKNPVLAWRVSANLQLYQQAEGKVASVTFSGSSNRERNFSREHWRQQGGAL